MPQEEVNAWASYEQTARAPRRLSVVADATLRQRNNVNTSRHSTHMGRHSTRASVSRHTAIDLAALSAEFPPSAAPTRRQSFFQDALSAELGQTKTRMSITEVGPEPVELDANVLEKIRTIFNVFFEDGTASRQSVDKSSRPKTVTSLLQSLNATMPWTRSKVHSPIWLFVDLCLRGIGQVVFQNSPLAGLLILIGLLIQSFRVALHGVLGLVVTNAAALILGFDKGLAGSGLFGYNALLVGLALATFDADQSYNAATLIASTIISTFTSILFVMMGKLLVPYKSPPLTLPFNVATLLFLLSTAHMGRVDFGSVRPPALPDYQDGNDDSFNITASQFFAGTIRGLGQVYLADHLAAGFLVLFGMAACSRISAVAALIGSAIGASFAVATGVPAQVVESGLYGFNPSLSVTAMFMFYSPSWGAGILAVMAGVMTVVAQQALATLLEPWGLPFMTLPFCVVALPFIVIQGTTSIVIAVPLASMTVPEDHLRVVKMLRDGFTFLMEAVTEPSDNELKRSSSKMHSRKLAKSLALLGAALDQADEAHGGNPSQPNQQKSMEWTKSLEARHQEETKMAASAIFRALQSAIDEEATQKEVPLTRITDAFHAAGLNDSEALNFASLILTLIDLDDSATIDEPEFICFALVARAMYTIRSKICKFCDFVDEDGNGSVSFDEVDAALEYLGQPVLDDESKLRLLELTRNHGHIIDENGNDGDSEEMDIMELVNVVTVAKVKVFTSAFHGCDTTASLSNNNVAWRGGEMKDRSTGMDGTDMDC